MAQIPSNRSMPDNMPSGEGLPVSGFQAQSFGRSFPEIQAVRAR